MERESGTDYILLSGDKVTEMAGGEAVAAEEITIVLASLTSGIMASDGNGRGVANIGVCLAGASVFVEPSVSEGFDSFAGGSSKSQGRGTCRQ